MAAILNKVGSQEARELLQRIEEQDPDLANEIKRLMFLFEDIIYIDDRSIQRILREVDKKDLALALKGADQKIKEKIFKNMSERAAAMLQEEIQYMGPVRLREVETSLSQEVSATGGSRTVAAILNNVTIKYRP